MLFRRHPEMSVTPTRQVPQLLDLLVVMLDVVLYWESSGIIHPDITTKPEQYACDLICEEFRVRSKILDSALRHLSV